MFVIKTLAESMGEEVEGGGRHCVWLLHCELSFEKIITSTVTIAIITCTQHPNVLVHFIGY